MGAWSILMPDVGEGVAEAEIVEWSVQVDDLVKEDQIVAGVMTDKATGDSNIGRPISERRRRCPCRGFGTDPD